MANPLRRVPALMAAAGAACLALAWFASRPAHGAEQPAWRVVYADGTPWRTPRGNIAAATNSTACELALVEAVSLVPSGTRLQCRKVKP